jgi:hypothetical protein
MLRRHQTRRLIHDNVSLDNQLKVRELITFSCFYCLLLTCSVLLAVPALLRILATPSHLSVVGLGVLNQLLPTPTAQEKSAQIFFAQPKAHQFKFTDLNKTVPTDLLKLIAFFKQCQATDKAAGVLKKITEDKKQPKEKKMAHLPAAHSHELSYQQHCCHKYPNYHRSNQSNRNNCRLDYHHQDN